MSRLVVAGFSLAACIAPLACLSMKPPSDVGHSDSPTSERLPPPDLLQRIAKADGVAIYEGLPRFADEQTKAKSTTLFGYQFYTVPLQVKVGDDKRLIALAANPSSYSELSGSGWCGMFHPDFAVEFKIGKKKCYAFIDTANCGEAKLYGPKSGMCFEFGVAQELKVLLAAYERSPTGGE